MIIINGTDYYSKDDILEALESIKEKKMKKNSPIEKLRYIGSKRIDYSLNELPSNVQFGDILMITWENQYIHFRDAYNRSLSSGDCVVYSPVGWIKFNPNYS